MNTFTVIGTVPDFKSDDFLLPAENAREFLEWVNSNRIDTIVTKGGIPTIKVRGLFAAKCKPGHKARYRIEYRDQRDGRRIHGLNIECL